MSLALFITILSGRYRDDRRSACRPWGRFYFRGKHL
jgi:hypothetical protein